MYNFTTSIYFDYVAHTSTIIFDEKNYVAIYEK